MLREATTEDLIALRDLERAANLVALSHVFPPDRYPFPDDDVLARWALVLEEPGMRVLVIDRDTGGLDAFAAFDETTLRHLAVHPDRWGGGLGSRLVEAAVVGIAEAGSNEAALWCLADNHRARRLYERLGWQVTAEAREAPWPPFPIELRFTRPALLPVR